MKVKATSKGYLGSLREVGDEFEVPDGTSASWFTPVAADPEPEAKPVRARKAKAEPAGDDEVADAI